ncbi:MAG: hypothetical protein JW832_07265 [Deltaproteobacteria bacterium]|nr:hypothetical protein [Deltaproteobacteria bacterium]
MLTAVAAQKKLKRHKKGPFEERMARWCFKITYQCKMLKGVRQTKYLTFPVLPLKFLTLQTYADTAGCPALAGCKKSRQSPHDGAACPEAGCGSLQQKYRHRHA